MIVIASYCALFAVMGGSVDALLVESIAGFRTSLWLVVVALAAHGLLDFTYHQLIAIPGVPAWWPSFCLSFDVVAAACFAWLLSQSRASAVAT
jgi:hypothetical protein